MHVVVGIIKLTIGHWVLSYNYLITHYAMILSFNHTHILHLYVQNQIQIQLHFELCLPRARKDVINVYNCQVTVVGINCIKSFDLYIIVMYPFYIQQASSKIKATF
jgi:ferritin-like protein